MNGNIWLDLMERIHIDYAGPFKGHYNFVIFDSYSKWSAVIEVSSITSKNYSRLFRRVYCEIRIAANNSEGQCSSIQGGRVHQILWGKWCSTEMFSLISPLHYGRALKQSGIQPLSIVLIVYLVNRDIQKIHKIYIYLTIGKVLFFSSWTPRKGPEV